LEHGVRFTIATDGPEMMRTHLRDEFALLLRVGALDESEARAANDRGHAAARAKYTLRSMVEGSSRHYRRSHAGTQRPRSDHPAPAGGDPPDRRGSVERGARSGAGDLAPHRQGALRRAAAEA